MNYLLHLLIYFNIYALLALSLNLVTGYCGFVTLAHAAYFAIGGYVYSLFSITFGWGFLPAAAVGGAIAMMLSLAVSIPSWRFRGDFFFMVSLSVQALIFSLLQNWTTPNAPLGSWANLTNGPFGINSIPRPRLFGWQASSLGDFWIVSSGAILVGGIIVFRLVHSPWGRLLKCIRDDELAARSIGQNPRKAKVEAFAIACGLAAVAGALYASYIGYIDPSSGSLDESILMICMVIVGGVGNFKGPLVGAAVLVAIPEILRFVEFPDTIASNMRNLVYGLLLVIISHFRPRGIAGEYVYQ